LRIAALVVLVSTIIAVLLLPGSAGCPPREPGEFDPLPCEPTAVSPPRLIVIVLGISIAVVLWLVALVRGTRD